MADQSDRIKNEAQETARIVEDAFRSISSKIGEYFEEALSKGEDVSKNMVRDVQGSLNSLSRVSKDLSSSFEKANRGLLKQKDYTREIQERNAKLAAIKAQIAIAEASGVGNAKELSKQYETILKYNIEYEAELTKQLNLSKNLNKSIGLTGSALSAASKITSKIGLSGMDDVFEEARDAAIEKAKALGVSENKSLGLIGKIKTMGSAFKVVGKAIVQNLTDPLILAGMLIKGLKSAYNFFASAYKEGKEAAMVISDESTNMARSLGLAQSAASKLASSVAGLGPTVAMSKQSVVSLYEAMGSTEKLSSETLRVFVKLNTQAGMSADSLVKFQKFAKLAGEDAGVMVKNMTNTALQAIKTNNLAISQKELLTESANQSAFIRVQFAKQPQELIKAVAASKQLGINMEKTRDISRSLLNFEDSIAAEMEAELLTGKDLNFERARQLALQGDSLGAAKEVLAQMGGIEEFNKLNVIQQEAMAAAAGMTVDQLTEQMDAAAGMKKENGDLVDEQQDGLKAMTSEVSKREREENRARKAAESNIAVYKELQPLVDSLRDTWIEIKKIVMDTLAENVLKPMMDFFKSEEGKNFLKALPDRVKKFTDGIISGIKAIRDFIKDHPKISMAVLGGAVLAKPAANLAAGLFTGDKGAALESMGIERGSKANPMYVSDVNRGNEGDMLDRVVGRLGSRWVRSMKWTKNLSKVFGSKNTYLGKQLRNLSAMFGKRSSFLNQIVKNNSTLSKIFPRLSTLNSKLPQDIAMNIGKSLRVDKAGNVIKAGTQGASGIMSKILPKGGNLITKAAPMLAKGLKALGPLGAVADLAIGGFTGASQADLSREEQKEKGIKEGIGKTEATIQGVLTGGAEKGSMFTSMFGGEKGSAGDELLGLGMSAGRGALAGAAIGSVVPVVGTAVGGAVGAVVGTVAEGFKIFTDPNSSLRKGIVNFASAAGEKISGWASAAGEKISGWASSAGEKISGWASSAGETISKGLGKVGSMFSSLGGKIANKFYQIKNKIVGAISNLPEMVKTKFIALKDKVVNAVTGIPGKITKTIRRIGGKVAKWLGFATGGIAHGGFRAFANGGVVTQPTLGLVGEGSMNEAIIPLPDGKSVPVKMQGGGSSSSGSDQKMIQLLERLVVAVEKGGTVILDGQAVGEALVAGSYRMQ